MQKSTNNYRIAFRKYENHKRKLNEEQIETLIKVYHAEIGDLLELEDTEKKRNATK